MAECGVDSSVPGHPQTDAGKGVDHQLELRSTVRGTLTQEHKLLYCGVPHQFI